MTLLRVSRAFTRIVAGALCVPGVMLFLSGCGASPEAARTESALPVVTRDMLYRQGHQLYLQQQLDSARSILTKALALNADDKEVLKDLAPLQYELAMRADSGSRKTALLKEARSSYAKLESLGETDADLYERLCEIANALNDSRAFLRYAKLNAERYPYDRQYYNLSVAYFNGGEYQNVIRICKDAVARFKQSNFVGTFYRQLGRAYMKVDRDQTAQKTFYAGLGVIDDRMAQMRNNDPGLAAGEAYARLRDDKIGILTSLKYLHTTYKEAEKLADVERQLKALGR